MHLGLLLALAAARALTVWDAAPRGLVEDADEAMDPSEPAHALIVRLGKLMLKQRAAEVAQKEAETAKAATLHKMRTR